MDYSISVGHIREALALANGCVELVFTFDLNDGGIRVVGRDDRKNMSHALMVPFSDLDGVENPLKAAVQQIIDQNA